MCVVVFAAGFRKILWRGGTDQKWLMADGPFLLFFGVKLHACRVKDPPVPHMSLAAAHCLGPQAASCSIELHAFGVDYVA